MRSRKHVVVFLDFPNLFGFCNSYPEIDFGVILNNIHDAVNTFGKIRNKKLYTRTMGKYSMESFKIWREMNEEWEFKSRLDKDIDTWIVTDAMELLFKHKRKEIVIVIVSGDTDYLYTLQKINQLGQRGVLLTPQHIGKDKIDEYKVEIYRVPMICPKCNGSGLYQNSTECWECTGTGEIKLQKI